MVDQELNEWDRLQNDLDQFEKNRKAQLQRRVDYSVVSGAMTLLIVLAVIIYAIFWK